MEYNYLINYPKKYNSCKWNGMKVKILSIDNNYCMVISKRGKKLRVNRKWLFNIN